MGDYEMAILQMQESEEDDCKHCDKKGKCNNECEEIVECRRLEDVYPGLFRNG